MDTASAGKERQGRSKFEGCQGYRLQGSTSLELPPRSSSSDSQSNSKKRHCACSCWTLTLCAVLAASTVAALLTAEVAHFRVMGPSAMPEMAPSADVSLAKPPAVPRLDTAAPVASRSSSVCNVPSFLGPSSCPSPSAAAAVATSKKLPPWVPPPDRFLFITCFRGRASNRHMCLKRSIILAALLNRTAVVPEEDVCPIRERLPLRRLYDLDHLQGCLALNRTHGAASLGGLSLARGQRIVRFGRNDTLIIDRLHCGGKACPHNWCGHPTIPLPNSSGSLFDEEKEEILTSEDLIRIRRDTADVRVLALGDLFYAAVEGFETLVGMPLGQLLGVPKTCQPLLRPTPEVHAAADQFLESFIGENFAALHLRRGDMASFCRRRGCHYPPLWEVAECVVDGMAAAGLRQLFLATDGAPAEIKHLEGLMKARGITMTRFVSLAGKIPSIDSAMVDKLICAKSKQFFFQASSTFALHAFDLRSALGKDRCSDRDLGGFMNLRWRVDYTNPNGSADWR